MRSFVRDNFEFFRQFRQQFETTGSVLPSSRGLARALTRPLREHSGACRVLEIGPGTGAVTRELVRLIGPDSRFDLVELNERFCENLRAKFDAHGDFAAVADRSRLHQCPIQEFRSEAPYQFIVSGLPLNNFPSALVREIFQVYFELLAPGGVLSYFEYMFVRPIRRAVSGAAEKQRLNELDAIAAPYLKDHRFRRDWVFANFPPAWAQHLRKPSP